MSQENVELVYRANDAVNRRDLDALLALADPNVEYSPLVRALEGGRALRGHAGIRSWWENMLGIAPDFSTEVEDVRDLGDTTVARVHLRGHGIASGATIDRHAWQVAEWRQAQCVRWRTFNGEAAALEAAGLSE
ncbi:MAG TPA: nuclear transport factor 2 family protein [Solirubrobacterales bacterium]|nr:nuclear transport factor 2 family protein [Solirubrobacterales bacterium]